MLRRWRGRWSLEREEGRQHLIPPFSTLLVILQFPERLVHCLRIRHCSSLPAYCSPRRLGMLRTEWGWHGWSLGRAGERAYAAG